MQGIQNQIQQQVVFWIYGNKHKIYDIYWLHYWIIRDFLMFQNKNNNDD